MTKKAATG